jgi:Substrate binding domain of ABC-type glycine betaine transport system
MLQALATPDTFPNGRLLDYPPEWGSASGRALKKFDIPLTSVPAGSEGALVAELQAAVAGHKPLLMRFWSPHWVLAQMPVEWLKMPPCDPNDLKACIVAPPAIKVVWSGFKQKWPSGFALMKALVPLEFAAGRDSMQIEVQPKATSDAAALGAAVGRCRPTATRAAPRAAQRPLLAAGCRREQRLQLGGFFARRIAEAGRAFHLDDHRINRAVLMASRPCVRRDAAGRPSRVARGIGRTDGRRNRLPPALLLLAAPGRARQHAPSVLRVGKPFQQPGDRTARRMRIVSIRRRANTHLSHCTLGKQGRHAQPAEPYGTEKSPGLIRIPQRPQ